MENTDLEERVVHDDLNPQLGDGEDHNPVHSACALDSAHGQ
jgi:hypothetical protein